VAASEGNDEVEVEAPDQLEALEVSLPGSSTLGFTTLIGVPAAYATIWFKTSACTSYRVTPADIDMVADRLSALAAAPPVWRRAAERRGDASGAHA
jgi:hypothetical protein